MTTLSVHSMFYTLQGEGVHSGKPAVFVRFSGCNVWSGREEHRDRDAARGACARICDTVFVGRDAFNGGGYCSPVELATRVSRLWPLPAAPFVVLTGGEPALQITREVTEELRTRSMYVAVETNGSLPLPDVDWVCVSPKPPMPVVLERADEVKILYPLFDPAPFEHLSTVRWLQPVDDILKVQNMRAAVAYAMQHPGWRVGRQTHKDWGIQ